MANDIGSVKGVSGSSMALNNQSGQGTAKPSAGGKHDPGGFKPARTPEAPVPMPK